jgi:hypothetical protein
MSHVKTLIILDDILKDAEDSVSLKFIVKLDYLPEFSESFSLKKMVQNADQLRKVQALELHNEIATVENMINEQ